MKRSNELQKSLNIKFLQTIPKHSSYHRVLLTYMYKNSELIFLLDSNQRGTIVACVRLGSQYLLYSTYRGTCDVCDYFNEGATNEDIRKICMNVMSDTLIFESFTELKEYITMMYLTRNDIEPPDYAYNGFAPEMFELIGEIDNDYSQHSAFSLKSNEIVGDTQVYWYKMDGYSDDSVYYLYKDNVLISKLYKNVLAKNLTIISGKVPTKEQLSMLNGINIEYAISRLDRMSKLNNELNACDAVKTMFTLASCSISNCAITVI